MKDTKQIIGELVEQVMNEMTATGAVGGYQTKFAFGKGDRTKKIAKSSKYHLHDSAVYFNEMKPKYEGYTSPVDYWTDMRQAHQARKEQTYEAKQAGPNKVRGFRGVKTRKGVWGKPWRRW